MQNVVSLFIDGLPKDMTREWLLQIFKKEGEILDVYVSPKRRHNNVCWFGFVRFKRVEEARSAIRNLNGTVIRGRCMEVSFAKYDKNGLPWNVEVPQATDQASDELAMREGNYRLATKEGRTFKEVVKGKHHLREAEEGTLKNHTSVTVFDADKVGLKLTKKKLLGCLGVSLKRFLRQHV